MASDYWEKRAIDSIGRMESTVNGQIPDLVKSFEAARRNLTDQVERFYARYEKNNQISLMDAQRQLSFNEMRDFKDDLKEFEKLAKDSIGTFNLQVDNMSVKARITRLEALQMQCDAILQKLYQEKAKQITDTASDIFSSEYYHQIFDIEQYTGFKFEFSKLSGSTIQKVVEQPVYGMDISEHLWRQDIDTGFKIRSTLNQMFVTGKPPQYFAGELQKQIGAVRVDEKGNVTGTGKKYEAYRLLYNESAHCVNQAQLQAYSDDGIEEYEVIETLDRKTCDECQGMDGKHFPVKDAVESVNHPPFHVSCRGTTGAYIPDLADLSTTRAARGDEGNTFQTTAKNYAEWAKENGI
jgi:SPP1 gp7 family putative phage head morphogenesis protein